MNCPEFRRKLLIEPRSRDKELADHASSCPECASEAEQAYRFEDRLHAALDVPRPVRLEPRIMSARSRATERGLSGFGSRWLALAAGALLAIGLAGWMGYEWDRYFGVSSGLEMAVVNHIKYELDHLHDDQDVRPENLEFLLSQFGAGMEGDVGRVSFASRCDIGRHSGVHMVVPGQQGPITVLIMPGEYLMQAQQVRSPRFFGVIVPTVYGSMAVVGEKLEPVEEVVEKMQRAIIWYTSPHLSPGFARSPQPTPRPLQRRGAGSG